MPRVKRGKTHVARRKRLLKKAKGFKWGRKKSIRLGRVAVTKAGVYAFRDRRVKKRSARRLWQIQINAGARDQNISYSKLIDALKKKQVALDRKILSTLAKEHPKVFTTVVNKVKS